MSIINRTRLRASRSTRAGLAAAALAAAMAPGVADAHLDDPGRKAPAGCLAVAVQRGDTTWKVATANGLTLDAIAKLNPHIADLARIHPGDELAVSCDPAGVALAIPQAVTRDADVARWLDEREADGRMTWRSVVAHLYAQGMRGDDLLTLAAIAECESNRWPTAVGDAHLANSKWGNSYGFLQVRSLHAARGSGAPRDADALATSVEHQAWAAVEVWRTQGPKAWTCWQQGHHKGQLGFVRAAAAEIGVA